MWDILTGNMFFDDLFFTEQEKQMGGGLDHTLKCVLQPQESSDLPSEWNGNVDFKDLHDIMVDTKKI